MNPAWLWVPTSPSIELANNAPSVKSSLLLCLICEKALPSTLCSTDVAHASFGVYILTIKRVDSGEILTLENYEFLVLLHFVMWCSASMGPPIPKSKNLSEFPCLLTLKRSLNVFTKFRSCKTLEMMEVRKNWQPVLLVVVYENLKSFHVRSVAEVVRFQRRGTWTPLPNRSGLSNWLDCFA